MKTIFIIASFSICILTGSAQEKRVVVLFDYNKSDIPDSSMFKLMKIIAKNNITNVMIEGHCDSIGSQQYNYILSEKRAQEVKKLLTQNGVDKSTIKTCIGYGEDQPFISNISEKDRQQNRRVLVHFFIKESVKHDTIKSTSGLDRKDFKAGKKIILQNMLFYGGQHILKPESFAVLQNLCEILQRNPTLKIEIQGHVCCTSFELDGYDIDTRTDNLSVNRAAMIYDYLNTNCGIPKSRLSYKGFGGTQKIIENDFTEAQQRINRRVEIKVLEE